MGSLLRTVLLAAFAVYALAGSVTILGKTSDGCASYSWDITGASTNDDCSSENELPFSAVTIYLQSASMAGNAAPNTIPNEVDTGAAVTVTPASGTTLNPTIGATTYDDEFCLAKSDSCDDIDWTKSCANIANVVATTPGAAPTYTFPLKTGTGTTAANWNSVSMELEDSPRKLCVVRYAAGADKTNSANVQATFYTGLRIASVYGCKVNADCTGQPAANNNLALYTGITDYQVQQIKQRTVCCAGTVAQSLTAGICINPNVQSCCGGVGMESSLDKCCDATQERVRFYTAACPCWSTSTSSTGCPSTEPECCLPNKYVELEPHKNLTGVAGECYHPNNHRCCNTGARYDPGTQQCCVVNGLQSLNFPCPCQEDTDCQGGQVAPGSQVATAQVNSNHRCCKQKWPTPAETAFCTSYSNFQGTNDLAGTTQTTISDGSYHPGQNNVYQLHRCHGHCIDTSYQICCNGVSCRSEFEKCCNSTCCNRFVGTCAEGVRPGALGAAANDMEYAVKYEQCTIIENLGPIKAFWVYVLPAFLLTATLLALALVILFANNVSARSYSFVESGMVIVGVLLILAALPFYFSPAYKYSVMFVVVALICVLSASARVKWLNVLALGAVILLVLYVVDPFHGNELFNFGYYRLENGMPDPEGAGILHTVQDLFNRPKMCVDYYKYFMLDPLLHDHERIHNPHKTTYGYCSRGWIMTLLVFAAVCIILTLLLFVLTLVALVLRFRKQKYEPIELEVRAVPE
eukprot:NODE_91_length_2354_cov_109.447238_g70_i0.p1 GENE.NODE_91_length_2354_cov_109.447238_g70_i0~~NODE_91_length_2354_cov_109.447238_g70_i0.p1  ORF type:complete len:748 (+),score=210.11 NODE_91_length_2354_cov_109.447238_g70_i0:64-2307(+)